MTTTSKDVIIMEDINNLLKCSDCNKNKDFLNIINLIEKYIAEHNCKHEFIEDYIDLTPESGKYIKYCKYCFLEP